MKEMNRINALFQKKKSGILSIYFTAGFPALNDTVEIIAALENAGVDLIEIGMPFSDPLADGPVIQQSSSIALKNGMNMDVLFGQLKDIRSRVKIPLVLMGYMNPVLQYGVEAFCSKAAECGIDGLILPDLPPDLYKSNYQDLFEQYGLKNILLITPRTSDQRIREIDDLSGGFLYAVSSSATTGANSSNPVQQNAYFERLKNMQLKNPVMIGFSISNRDQFNHVCQYAAGAIVGTAFIRKLSATANLPQVVSEFLSELK